MKRFCILALTLLICGSASADLSKFDIPDKRLDQKVTLDVDNVRLEDVAKQITEKSGVTVKAGIGQRDWKVRDQRVCVRATDVPLGDLLDQIAKLSSFCISREGKEGEWTYLIWQDKNGRDLEAEMLNAQREEAAQRVVKSRQGTIDLAKDALKMSPEEAMKQRDKNPVLAYMGGTKTGRGFAGFLSGFQANFPTEYDLMMRGKHVFVPLAGLPANMQQAMNGILGGGMADAIKKTIDSEKKPGEVIPELTPYQIVFQPASEQGGPDVESLGFGGLAFLTGVGPDGKPFNNAQFGGGIPMSVFALTDPDSTLGKLIGAGLIGVEEGASLNDMNKELNERANNDPSFIADILAHESPTEKTPPTDPALTREVEIKDVLSGASAKLFTGMQSEKYQGKILAELSRAIGQPVLKEQYSGEMVVLGLFVKPGKQPLYKVLVGLEKAGCIWTRDGGSLRVRPSDWALLRSYAIPASFMEHYRELLNTNGQLNLDDVALIASGLTDGQIDRSFKNDPDFSFLNSALSGSQGGGPRALLRFYASLSPAQRQSIAIAPGLAFGDLSDAQWQYLSQFVDDRFAGLFVIDGSIFLKPQNETQLKIGSQSQTFEITVSIQDEQDPRKAAQALYLPGKNQIKEIRDARKKAEEAEKAAVEKKPEPSQTK